MKYLFASALMGLACAESVSAQTYATAVHLMIESNSSEDGSTKVIDEETAVLVTNAYSPRAARISQDVTVGMIGTGYDLKAGSVLFGRYEDSVWTYCGSFGMNTESAAASAVTLGVLTAGFTLLLEPFMDRKNTICLYDENNDGVFDTGWGDASPAAGGSKRIVYSLAPKSMTTSVPYERIDPQEGPKIPMDIIWRKPGRTGLITFILRMDGQNISKKTTAIPVSGDKPMTVDLGGVEFALQSYDAVNETIRIEIVKGYAARYERIPAVLTVSTSYYY